MTTIAEMPEAVARAFVERGQRLREEKAAIENDLKELYGEVKSAHGTMARATIKGAVDALMRPEDKQAERERIADEVQALVDLIRDGKPVSQAPEIQEKTQHHNERAHTRTCESAPTVDEGSTPHDPDTGEIIETKSAALNPADVAPNAGPQPGPATPRETGEAADSLSESEPSAAPYGGERGASTSKTHSRDAEQPQAEGAMPCHLGSGPIDRANSGNSPQSPNEIMGDMPEFLKRQQNAA